MIKSEETGSGFSGRKITPVIVFVLLLICVGIAFFVTVVHRLQQAREATAGQWRQLAVLLDRDYRHIEQLWSAQAGKQTDSKSQRQTDSTDPPASIQQFRLVSDEFRTTVDIATQRSVADSIEQFLERYGGQLSLEITAHGELKATVDQYNVLLTREREISSSIGGRLVRVFLLLPELQDFHLGR